MLIHRGADCGPIELTVHLEGLPARGQADVATLSGATWYDRNTLDAPDNVIPQHTQVAMDERRLMLTLPPFSLTRVTI